jgi:hypothetical protein
LSTKTVQTRIEDIIPFYTNLAGVLTEMGIGGDRLNQIFACHLSAECVQCGIRIRGEELGCLAVAVENPQSLHSKLQRLRLGYCARESCACAFYLIRLDDVSDVDWTTAAEKTGQRVHELEATAKKQEQEKRKPSPARRLALALAIVSTIFLLRYAMAHKYWPFVQKPQKYQIDPNPTGWKTQR